MPQRLRGSVVMLLALLVTTMLVAAGCSGGTDTADEGSSSAPSMAPVSPAPAESGEAGIPSVIADYSITVDAMQPIPAGQTTFAITNDGPSEHEFVVASTDLDASKLPVDGNTVDEESLKSVGEAEDIAPGASATLELNLKPGHYVVICNIPGHYQLGMWANLEVK